MPTVRVSFFLVVLGFLFVHAEVSFAQDETTTKPATTQPQSVSNQKEEGKLKLESKALALLEEVISETQTLKLPENRVRVQIASGDMLWARDEARARELFGGAGAAIAQMTGQADRGENLTRFLRRQRW